MVKKAKRNREIPDPAISFHATGLSGLNKREIKELEQIIKPAEKYFNNSFSKYLPHVSCRYLGYKDEVSFNRIKKVVPKLKKIYSEFLPLECATGKIFCGWKKHPDYKPKLIMIKICSPELLKLHKNILSITKDFPIFSKVEGKKINPHFSLGSLKKEFEDKIPKEVNDFVKNLKIKPIKFYLRSAYIHKNKERGFEKI